MRRRRSPVLAGGCAALFALTTATSGFAQSRQPGAPPAPGVEKSIWELAEKAELSAKTAGARITDAELERYLSGIKCEVAPEYCADMRVYLMNLPAFNAMMAPNGYMEVWSGMLLRAENTAQVAFVVAHETGHFEESHSIESFETMRARANAALFLQLLAGALGVPALGDLVYLGFLVSLLGYSRENETEADLIGFRRSVAAGYTPEEGARLWRNLIAETAASQFPDVRRREARSSVLNTHPVSADRAAAIDSLARQVRADPAQAGRVFRDGTAEHRAAIRPHLRVWLRDELRRRDYGQYFHLVARLKGRGEDVGLLTYFEAEGHRLRRNEGDLARAATLYQEAMRQPDAPPEAWREWADIRHRDGNTEDARAGWQTYLDRAPNAEDRALIERRISRLSTPGAAVPSQGGS